MTSPIKNLRCPYCKFLFTEAPRGKKRCTACHNVVWVKQRWGEMERQLVTKEEALLIEKDWQAQYAESRKKEEQISAEFRRESEILAVAPPEMPDIDEKDIGIIWYNSEDDCVCDKCLDMTGQWLTPIEASRKAREIHPDGSCRCISHFELGNPAEALVGSGKVKQKMRPMTEKDKTELNAAVQEIFGVSYEQLLNGIIGGMKAKDKEEN